MNKIYTIAFFICMQLIYASHVLAQVDLPYTLSFTTNDAANWADGIANDGDGSTSAINDLDIEIFAATSSFTLLPGSTIVWHDNDYLSSGDPGYTAITPGPDIPVTNNGVPAMVLRSTNAATNFSLEGLTLYDWGGTSTLTIEAFNNGISLGSVQLVFDQVTWPTETISQADILTPSVFQSVDEVRFYPSSASAIWLSINDISLAEPSGTLPVQWLSFNASLTNENNAVLEWQTSAEENNLHFIIEHSSDGITYSDKGEVAAGSNASGVNNYQYIVAGLAAGKHYFRIRQVDVDGRSSYSRIVTLIAGTQSRIAVYPNPVRSTATINAGGRIIEQVLVYDVTGKLMQRIEPHTSQPVIQMATYPKGMYVMEVFTAEGKQRMRILKE